jgi:hypothetical protein
LGWVTFWAIFPQTNLVTLAEVYLEATNLTKRFLNEVTKARIEGMTFFC